MDLNKISKGIEKTGFKLEFNVSTMLIKHGWNVINNKYYIDDLQKSVREIDLVSYKATKVHHFYVYTVLIVSCKKNEKDAWALLSKQRASKDPNKEWLPVHAWSNDKAIDYMINEKNWRNKYLSYNKKHGSTILSKIPNNHIFAFQEMNKSSGNPNNDKNIFNSITSLMKAQAYEMNALPNRKKDPSIFQFNLLSIMDTDLIRIDFSNIDIKSKIIDEEVYVADYIIDKQQTSAKIHFIKSSAFEKVINQYNMLHEANELSFESTFLDFYANAAEIASKHNVFIDEIRKEMYWSVRSSLKKSERGSIEPKDIWLYWDNKTKTLEFSVCTEDSFAEKLNDDKELLDKLAKTLKKYLKYDGKFIFAEGIPF